LIKDLLQETKFIDKKKKKNGNTISYFVKVFDKSNNVSEASALAFIVLPVDTTSQIPASNIVITKNTENNSNSISWKNDAKNIEGFMVFRKTSEEEDFVSVSDLITSTSFIDVSIENRLTYQYYIRTFFKDGGFKNSVFVK